MTDRPIGWVGPLVVALLGFTAGFGVVFLLKGEPGDHGEEVAAPGGPVVRPPAGPDDAPASAVAGQRAGSGAPSGEPGARGAQAGDAGLHGDEPRAAGAPRPETGPGEADGAREPTRGGARGQEAASPPPKGATSRPSDARPGPGDQAGQGKERQGGQGAPPAATDLERWTKLLGLPCRIDFQGVAALVVRAGDLQHGQTVVYRRDIAPRPKIGRISSEDQAAHIVPLAFGFHPSSGRPVAVYGKIHVAPNGKVRDFDGVVPLKVSGRYLGLIPTAGLGGRGE